MLPPSPEAPHRNTPVLRHAAALSAALVAFRRSCDDGAARDVAATVAIARYRAFVPDAAEAFVRAALAHALASERRRAVPGRMFAPIALRPTGTV